MALREDCGGLESLPLKLLIVAVVASLSIVPAAEALENLRNRDYLTRAELQLDMIVSTAQTLAIQGPGGARTLALDFGSEGTIAFERMTIGDREGGPNMSSVVLRFSTGATMIKTASEPPVWMRAAGRQGLVITSPSFELRMSADIDGRAEFVAVELV